MLQKKGLFLTIEGIEGVGKSTALQFIRDYLAKANQDVVVTREPGGTQIAEQIRQILLNPDEIEAITPNTELLLMFAGRAQHLSQCIIPSLLLGKWVLSDRFVDASYAYQGGGRGIKFDKIAMLESWIVNQWQPDVTLLLDAPVELGLARAKHRGPQDRIEKEKIEFFERVRIGYLHRAAQHKERFTIMDASQSIETVHGEIKIVLDDLLEKHKHAQSC